jgi:hypothetical protein
MPAISMFFGIVIYMYFFDDEALAVTGNPPFQIEPLR